MHIIKKAVQMKQENKDFKLGAYLLEYPYQTIASIGAALGAYMVMLPVDTITISAAFFAGVAANSTADIAKGRR